MPDTSRRKKANQHNAKASTGPVTQLGKARSSANAMRHGVLSHKLLLPAEDGGAFSALLQSLMAELGPVGTMEQLLVERIAVTIWRQRRMVGAESAAVVEQQVLTGFAAISRIQSIASLPDSDQDWIREMVKDLPQRESYVASIGQIEACQTAQSPITTFRDEYPRIWVELCSEAESPPGLGHTAQCKLAMSFLKANYGSLQHWLSNLGLEHRKMLRLIDAATTVREARSMSEQSDLLSRYQSALDNEWFKGLRALRDAQKFRLEQAAMNAKPVVPDLQGT